MNSWSIKSWSILTAILCLIIVVLTVVSTLFSVKDLLYESLCAILGVVLTACVTVLLLRGQTDTETEKARKDKVFEEKLQIYKDFLNALCDVLKDGVVTKEEYVQLQFQFATITMHTELANANKISVSVYNIINDLHESKDGLSDKLMEELLKIVDVLRSELYENTTLMSDKEKGDLVFNFTELRGSIEEMPEEQSAADIESTTRGSVNEENAKVSIKLFVEKLKECLQPWAKSENISVESYGDVHLRITSPIIGEDATKDYLRWSLTDTINIGVVQNGISDREKRRDIYTKVKQMGYPAVFSTGYGATVYPAWKERFIYPKTVAKNEYQGVLPRIINKDASLIQSYADWIMDVYQKFVEIKKGV